MGPSKRRIMKLCASVGRENPS